MNFIDLAITIKRLARMTSRTVIFATIFTFLLNTSGSGSDDQKIWELVQNTDAVRVFHKVPEKENIFEFKAITDLKSSFESPLQILKEIESYPKWLPSCQSIKKIKDYSDLRSLIYFVSKSPWPFQDRDIIAEYKMIPHSDQYVAVDIQAVNSNSFPAYKNFVRVDTFHAQLTLKQVDQETIRFIYQVQIDPGGSIPAFLARPVLGNQVYNAMINFRNSAIQQYAAQ